MKRSLSVILWLLLLAVPALARPAMHGSTVITTEIQRMFVAIDDGTITYTWIRFTFVYVVIDLPVARTHR